MDIFVAVTICMLILVPIAVCLLAVTWCLYDPGAICPDPILSCLRRIGLYRRPDDSASLENLETISRRLRYGVES